MLHLTIMAGYRAAIAHISAYPPGSRDERFGTSVLCARTRHRSVHPLDAMRSAKATRTKPAGKDPSGFAVAEVLMASGTGANPGGEFVGDRSAVQSLALIPELAGDYLPLGAMPCTGPRHRVGDFVQ